MRHKGIAFKMIVSILLSVGIIFIVLILFNYNMTRRLINDNIELSINKIAESAIDSIEIKLKSVEETTRVFSYLMFDRVVPLHLSKRFAKRVVESNPLIYGNEIAFEPNAYYHDSLYYGISYSKKSGESFFYNDYIDKPWYKKVINDKKPFWTDPFENAATNEYVCSFCMPIFMIDGDGKKVMGAMKSNVPITWLHDIVSGIEVYESGFATLLSKNGFFISHPNGEYINKESLSTLAAKNNTPDLLILDSNIKAGNDSVMKIENKPSDENGMIVYAPVADNNWAIAIFFPEKEYYGELNELHKNLIIIVIVGILVLFLVVAFISNRITKPLKRLSHLTQGLGEGNFDIKLPIIKSNDEVGQLNNSFILMQKELKSYIENLKNVTTAKQKIESDVRIAGEIQQNLIPKIFPEFPNKYGIDLYGKLKPAKDVSGDLFDFFFHDNYLYFAIGDVAGKGVPASQFMAITRTLFRANSKNFQSPNEIVSAINQELCQGNEQNLFVTFFLGKMNLNNGTIEYCNAGHNYPYIITKEFTIITLDQKHGLPLGLFEDKEYISDILTLGVDETIVLYTDGITEAENKYQELFNDDRLKETLTLRKGVSAKVLTNLITSQVENFVSMAEQSDDLTVLVVSRRDS